MHLNCIALQRKACQFDLHRASHSKQAFHVSVHKWLCMPNMMDKCATGQPKLAIRSTDHLRKLAFPKTVNYTEFDELGIRIAKHLSIEYERHQDERLDALAWQGQQARHRHRKAAAVGAYRSLDLQLSILSKISLRWLRARFPEIWRPRSREH